MKILYGVQGTGNGHTTRARIMAKAFAKVGAEVDWVFSGRKRNDYFDMEIFGNFQSYQGLTFATEQGKIHYLKTLLSSNFSQLYQDIKHINVEGYDFIVNDFEPVTAWAARRSGKKVIGLSHQNAFLYDIPKAGSNIFVNWFMHNFAPVTTPIGLHWHHFDQPILPPLVEHFHYRNCATEKHYLVYLPFSNPKDIEPQLREFPEYDFYIYQAVPAAYDDENIHVRPFSRNNFQEDLHRCEGVICSAGFELPSEAIHLGKKVLVQPVEGQMEQKSNALALKQLGLGYSTDHFDMNTLSEWLRTKPPITPRNYPDVAKALVDWLLAGGGDIKNLQQALWEETQDLQLKPA